ncbi:hypothetical protein G7046_g1031 [Stylonectria norvegica]|nr:hypothetical protein G7046_g1031 [Stylonectria norvegica]
MDLPVANGDGDGDAHGLADANANGDADLRFLPSLDRRHRPSKSTSSVQSAGYFNYSSDLRHHQYHHHDDPEHDADSDPPGVRTPSLLSSPSVASSLGFSTGRMSPLRREIARSTTSSSHHGSSHQLPHYESPHNEPNYDHADFEASPTARRSTGRLRGTPTRNRDALARRLSQLAHQLTSTTHDDHVDDDGVDALTYQLNLMEKAMTRKQSPSPIPQRTPQRPMSIDWRSKSDQSPNGGSLFSSPASSIFRSRYSDLSASIFRDPEPEPEPPKTGMTIDQAKKVLVEVTQLNEELTNALTNLKARQEESDVSPINPDRVSQLTEQHIHALLIERAERAAQRILFLQNRIIHLSVPQLFTSSPLVSNIPSNISSEQELHENDDELQHLRICLKAVEIQMPPHPDPDLQRCIVTFKQDYQALKRKRANRPSIASISSFDSTQLGSPS